MSQPTQADGKPSAQTAVSPSAGPAASPSAEAAKEAVPPPQSPAQTASGKQESKAPAVADSGPRVVRFLILPKPDNINLPITRATDYAYDERTGRLAILGPWENGIGFIAVDEQPRGGTIENVRGIPLRGEPHAITYHGMSGGSGVFAVAQTKEMGIILLDAESLQIVKSLRTDSFPTFMWAAGKSDDKYFYFTTEIERGPDILITDGDAFRLPAGWKVKMQRIDLASMELDQRFQGEELQTSSVLKFGEGLVRFFQDIVFLDRDERFLAYKDGLYSSDDGRKLTTLKFQAQRFLPAGPWLTGVNECEIVVGSINDGRIVAGVSLPDVHEKLLGRIMEKGRGHVFAKIFLDLKRNYLVVGRLQHVIIIPIETLGLPQVPIVLLDGSPPTKVQKGGLYEFTLRTVSGDGSFTLTEKPEGMTLDGNAIRWRPAEAYTAPVQVKVKTTAGEISREESWQITVE